MDRETNSILIGEPDSQEDEVMSSEETPKPKTKRVKKKTEAESMAENAEETQGKPEYSEVTEQPQSAGQKRRWKPEEVQKPKKARQIPYGMKYIMLTGPGVS